MIPCHCNMFLYIIMSLVLIGSCEDTYPKTSLVFVIDKTESMGSVMKHVEKGASAIFDATKSANSPIFNVVLVLFGDPYVSPAIVTTDEKEFKNALVDSFNNLEKGNDCPESCMKGIKIAIEASLHGSYVYIFTDAYASDFDQYDEVKRMAQEKGCQLVFILLGICMDVYETSTVPKEYIVYPQLAEATGGQIFHLRDNDTETIMNYVKYSISTRRVILNTTRFPAGRNNVVNIASDLKMKNLGISIAASDKTDSANIRLGIVGPDGEVDEDTIIDRGGLLILAVNGSEPGTYELKYRCDVPSYILVTAESNVTFRHGFSQTIVSSLENTAFSPIPETKNYLFIKLFGEEVKLVSVKLLSLDYSLLLELPLGLKDKDQTLYVTELFDPPTCKFRIAVIGVVNTTNAENDSDSGTDDTRIVRFGNLVLQTEVLVKVNIEGASKRTVRYDDSLTLNCTVNSNSSPKVFAWRDSKGKDIPSTKFEREAPLNSSRILTLHKLQKNETYECYAGKSSNNDSKTVQVQVKKTHLEEKPVFEEPKYQEIYVYPNDNVNLSCSLRQGHPKPKLNWNFKLNLRPYELKDFTEKYIYENQTSITLTKVNKFQTGIYQCVVTNSVSWAVKEFALYVQSKPKVELINTKNEIVKEIVVKKGEMVNVKCLVEGVPSPTVTWLQNGKTIDKKDNIQFIKDVHMRFKADSHHTGNYTCQAVNKIGNDSKSVLITVHYLNITFPKNTNYELNLGENVNLPCGDYINGMPKLTYTWTFTRFGNMNSEPVIEKSESTEKGAIVIINGNLELQKLWADQSGSYHCKASNGDDTQIFTFTVNVLFPPKVDEKQITSYQAVQGDCRLKIVCNITGNPIPTITWANNNGLSLVNGYENRIWYDNYGNLTISDVSLTDRGIYTCNSQSEKFVNRKPSVTINVTVTKYPDPALVSEPNVLTYNSGSKVLMKCNASSEPTEKVTWFKNQTFIRTGKLLELPSIKLSDAGVYTCRVSSCDSASVKHEITNVIVGFEPKFNTSSATVMEFELYIGQNVALDCSASAEPKPKVTWWLDRNRKEGVTDMVYDVKMENKLNVTYMCQVQNSFGVVYRIFNLKLKNCILQINKYTNNQPLLLTPTGTWPSYITEGENTTIPIFDEVMFSCPTNFKGGIGTKQVTAMCYGETKFYFKNKVYDFKDIQCKKPIKPKIIVNNTKLCQGKGTSTVKIQFDLKIYKALEAFEYCRDKYANAKYAKYRMKSPAGYIPQNTRMWDSTDLGVYSCNEQNKQLSLIAFDFQKRCFALRHLVNPRDVFPGPLQRATYNRLNMVLQWSTRNSENWEELENKVRNYRTTTDNDLIIYTGTAGELQMPSLKSGYNKPIIFHNHLSVPTYLWKVIQNNVTKSSVVIIQLNIPGIGYSEMDYYIRCYDLCHKISWLTGPDWRNVKKGYTFCCTLEDFRDNFDEIKEIQFEPHYDLLET